MEPMNVQGELHKNDIICYFFFHRRYPLWGLLAGFVFLPFWFLFIGYGYEYPLAALGQSFPYALLAFLLVLGGQYVAAVRAYQQTPEFQESIVLTIEPSGFARTTAHGHLSLTWSDIRKVHDHQHRFILYVSTEQALILPHRFFPSQDQAMVFKDMLQQHLTPCQRGRGMNSITSSQKTNKQG